jgi:hypothetical protein
MTACYSYKIDMVVHVIADSPEEAKTQLDEKGGIVTKREVELLHSEPLYGES